MNLYLFMPIQKSYEQHDNRENMYSFLLVSVFSFFMSLGIYLIFRSDDLLLVNYFLSKVEILEIGRAHV